jgi:hypothetical protein
MFKHRIDKGTIAVAVAMEVKGAGIILSGEIPEISMMVAGLGVSALYECDQPHSNVHR